MRWVRDHVPVYTDGKLVIELGSRNVNGTVRDLFTGANYLGIDILAGDGVDVIADAATFATMHQADVVVSTEMLEHTGLALAADIMANMADLVKPGGALIITCAGPNRQPHSAIDGTTLREGERYGNIHPQMMVEWLTGWERADIVLARAGMDLYVAATR